MTVVTVMGRSINLLVRDAAALLSQADDAILLPPFPFHGGVGGDNFLRMCGCGFPDHHTYSNFDWIIHFCHVSKIQVSKT